MKFADIKRDQNWIHEERYSQERYHSVRIWCLVYLGKFNFQWFKDLKLYFLALEASKKKAKIMTTHFSFGKANQCCLLFWSLLGGIPITLVTFDLIGNQNAFLIFTATYINWSSIELAGRGRDNSSACWTSGSERGPHI